jgi:type IV pilus assembly protein PilB
MIQVRLAELLLRAGVVTEDQVRSALAAQAHSGRRLGQVLVDQRAIGEVELSEALARLSGLPRFPAGTLQPDPAAKDWVDPAWLERYGVALLVADTTNNALVVALSDPTDVGPLDELALKSGLRVAPFLASDAEIERLHQQLRSAVPTSAPPPPPPPTAQSGSWILHDMNELRDDLHGLSSVPPAPSDPRDAQLADRLRPLLDAQQDAARELQLLFELCVDAGLIKRQEYLERLDRLNEEAAAGGGR